MQVGNKLGDDRRVVTLYSEPEYSHRIAKKGLGLGSEPTMVPGFLLANRRRCHTPQPGVDESTLPSMRYSRWIFRDMVPRHVFTKLAFFFEFEPHRLISMAPLHDDPAGYNSTCPVTCASLD